MTKEIKEQLSEMELIRLRSVNPEFLHECDMKSRVVHEMNKERDYANLIKRQLANKLAYLDKTRVAFEKNLK